MKHTCHALDCNTFVPPSMFMCKKRWLQLPKAKRDAVWREYRQGQEITKTPSAKYMEVTRDAIEWLANKEREDAREALADHLFNEWFVKNN